MNNEALKIDEIVWQFVGIAHEALKAKELKEYYPELAPFLEYLVKNYPALEGNNEPIRTN